MPAPTTPPTVSGFTGPAPNRTDPANFSPRMDTYLGEMQPNIDSQNDLAGWMEDTATDVFTDATTASNAAAVANYQGPYNAGTTYAIGEAVDYLGLFWVSKQNGNIGNTPAGGSAFWQKIDTTAVSVDETGFDLDWSVDDVLKFTATADFAITFSNVPVSGVAFVEITGGGDWTPTYPAAVEWDGGSPPALAPGTNTTVLQFYTSNAGTKVLGRALYGDIA